MTVTDSDGQRWRVTRRWVPWRRRLKGVGDSAPDFPVMGDDPISAIIGLVLLVVMIPFLILAFVAALEVLLLLALLPVIGLVRIPFGRHWVVEARRGFGRWYEEDAGDWRASRARIREIRDLIAEGERPTPNVGGVGETGRR